MSEDKSVENVSRYISRIRHLHNMLKQDYFVLFDEGDPDFPEGVKLPIPKSWKTEIRKCINTLKQKLKQETDKW